MLNSKNYDELLLCSVENTKKLFESLLSIESLSFKNIREFPSSFGIYFVYLDSEILYIGKADKQSIKERCNQYLHKSSGATLRQKIESVKVCDEDQAINYIRQFLKVKYILLDNINQIPTIEDVAIWCYQPKLNAIKHNFFSYEQLAVALPLAAGN